MTDQKLSERKLDHLNLTQQSQTSPTSGLGGFDVRDHFYYEPVLSGFPDDKTSLTAPTIGGKKLKVPMWVSSMTGGTGPARAVNQNLALICGEFGLGMGLGSCRSLLESNQYFDDFALRARIGQDTPFFANIGIAQVIELLAKDNLKSFLELCKRLEVDGFFIHINPLQEWHQKEGDQWSSSPLRVIEQVLDLLKGTGLYLGVKEVGQGMGPKSLEALLQLPLEVIEFAAFGGTNFSYLEQLRDKKDPSPLSFVGHTAQEMLDFANDVIKSKGETIRCKNLIVSGGVRSSLEGYYYTMRSSLPAAYGMASPFLQAASQSEEVLRDFVQKQVDELRMATSFLHLKNKE